MTLKKAKQLGGLFVFLFSLTLYTITLEPANSFWDCSEFIACAYGLQVGHAPGAPVFMLLGRLISLLAPNPQKVAFAINMLSAISSAITVMLLFHTIVWFASQNSKNTINPKAINLKLLAAAVIGALSYAVSDSFWFSAVEAEVYATSSLFTALVFWAVLKYAESKKTHLANRWIILIFFILGLSVGIHLLNLLTIPAMAFVVYFKHYKPTRKGVVLCLGISISIMAFFIFGVIPGMVNMVAFADRIVVNGLNFPLYSGALVFIAMLIGLMVFLNRRFIIKGQKLAQLSLIAFSFWLIGYSSFAVLVIRSAKNPVVDINNVENLYGLVSYLNREQYPSRPLFYGNNYNSPIVEAKKRYTYKTYHGKYLKDELNPMYVFDENTLSFFPRMASMEERHIKAYKQWVNIKGRPVTATNNKGEREKIYIPTFKENLQFFWRYQFKHMYWRYFMWNFVGKQNDIQSYGGSLEGNWLSGISFVDQLRLGDTKEWPVFYQQHAALNKYFGLPFLLGIVGLIALFHRNRNNFWVSIGLFFFTGIAIVLYLNEVPITPRERDYVHVGSFYVFALWIGLGAYHIMEYFSKQKLGIVMASGAGLILFVSVPVLMLSQNYDDHNRSNRLTTNAYAKNMLQSCDENAILFTIADNDTYPLWYLQGVENYRPDVRNILMTFLPIDWYADQLHDQHGEMGKVDISFKGEELLMKQNNYFPIVSRIDSSIDLSQVIEFVKNNNSKTKLSTTDGQELNFIPGKYFKLAVDKDKVLKSCSYLKSADIAFPEFIAFSTSKNYLGRDDILVLDILAQNKWERPLYFVYPHLLDDLGLGEYLHREGMLYRFLPFTKEQLLAVNKERALQQYDLFMRQFTWGNVEKESVFLDHTNVIMTGSFRIRQVAVETAYLLIQSNEKLKAKAVLDKVQQILPPQKIPYDWSAPEMVKAYRAVGYENEAKALADKIKNEKLELYTYYEKRGSQISKNANMQQAAYVLQQLQ